MVWKESEVVAFIDRVMVLLGSSFHIIVALMVISFKTYAPEAANKYKRDIPHFLFVFELWIMIWVIQWEGKIMVEYLLQINFIT